MKQNADIGCFEAAWLFIWAMIKNSLVYKILRRAYGVISGAWRNSAVAGWFRRTHISKDALPVSLVGRAARLPFTFLEFIGRRFGARLSLKMKQSVLLNICRVYLDSLLALNLRFIGLIMLFSCVTMGGIRLILGQGIGAVIISCTVIGFLASLIDINITEYLKGSAFVRLILAVLGIEADFNWYDRENTNGLAPRIIAAAAGITVGTAGALLHPFLAPLTAAGAAGLFLVLKYPQAGVFFLVFLAPIAPTMAVVGLSLLCLFAMIVKSLITEGFKWKYDGIVFLIIAFIVIYFFAALTSFAPAKSFSIWAIYCAFMAAYILIINSVDSEKTLMNLLTTFVISGLFVCLYGIAQYVFGWDTTQAWMDEEMFTDIKMRIYSTLGNPNVLGEYILLVLPVSIGLMWTKKGAPAKIVYAGISAVMFAAIILTFSRGCWLGLLIAAAVFITFAAGKLWGLGLIALPILPMILPESIINRFTSIGDMSDSSTSYRVFIWMGSLAMVKDFWLSGIGMGQEAFTQIYPFYSYSGVVAPHSHNLFLQILVESGVCGIAVFLLIIILFLRKMMLGYQYGGKGDTISTLITALAAGVCGFLVQGMFDNCFYNYRVMLVFWCVLAMARACAGAAKQKKEGF